MATWRSAALQPSVQSLSRVWPRPHGLQHTRFPCPSVSPGICSNLHPLSRWCHPTVTSSVAPFSPCPQSFPVSRSSNELALSVRCQSIGASASASVLPIHIQDWFPSGLTGLILQSKGFSIVFFNTTIQKHLFFSTQPYLWSSSHNFKANFLCLYIL